MNKLLQLPNNTYRNQVNRQCDTSRHNIEIVGKSRVVEDGFKCAVNLCVYNNNYYKNQDAQVKIYDYVYTLSQKSIPPNH